MSSTAAPPPVAPSMRALGVVVAAFERWSGRSGRSRPEPVAVDRALHVTVAEVRREATDVVSLRLEPTVPRALPRWQPGAHIDVMVPTGALRQYSLCGDPAARTHYRIAVRRVGGAHGGGDGGGGDGGGSQAMHELRVGAALEVRGPRNAFPFIGTDRYLFVAGGIGITPIRPMVLDAALRAADWQLVYTGRDRASMPFLDELAALDPTRVHVWPDDECGLPEPRRILALAPAGAALYTCGPPPMIAAIRAEIPAERIATLHYERFSPAPVIGGRAFEIVLARSGRVVPVAATQTALAALQTVLPDLAYSCRQGFCGTCPARVLGGEVEHRDRCLTAAQRADRMAVCVSRGSGRITLDL